MHPRLEMRKTSSYRPSFSHPEAHPRRLFGEDGLEGLPAGLFEVMSAALPSVFLLA
jgi:hypothetical protein